MFDKTRFSYLNSILPSSVVKYVPGILIERHIAFYVPERFMYLSVKKSRKG